MTDNLAKFLYKVLKLYAVSVTRRTIEQTVLMHPDYPSMRCISDALDVWKVKHVVARLTPEKLRNLNVPVIARLKNDAYVLVTQITDSKVYFMNSSGKEKTESADRFEQEWSGIALIIENVTDAGEPNYNKKRGAMMV